MPFAPSPVFEPQMEDVNNKPISQQLLGRKKIEGHNFWGVFSCHYRNGFIFLPCKQTSLSKVHPHDESPMALFFLFLFNHPLTGSTTCSLPSIK